MLSQTREELAQQVKRKTCVSDMLGEFIVNISVQAAQREAVNRAALIEEHQQELAVLRQELARLQNANDSLQAEAMLQFADKAVWDEEVDKWK